MVRLTSENTPKEVDLIIIGGGITGCCIAYEAAANGLTVALFEKNDFGSATSAATSKLIHGGLRYLKNLELGLVRESLQERKVLGNITSNLVKPLKFLLLKYKGNFKKGAMLKVGMILYDMLSYDKGNVLDKKNKIPNHAHVSAKEMLKNEPLVKKENLVGAMSYYDYQNMNPDRMTLAFLNTAISLGAKAANYSSVTKFIYNENKDIKGVEVHDAINNTDYTVNGKMVINCTGTWSGEMLNKAMNKNAGHDLMRSEGVHIITKKLSNDAVAITTDEGDHLMVLPWRGHSIIGTTDNPYQGKPDDYKVSKKGIDELVHKLNKYFGNGDFKITYDDILHAYGGLRPLIGDDNVDSYNASRKYEIFDSEEDGIKGLLTVEGGKYTTSRNLAESVLKLLTKKGFELKNIDTQKGALLGCKVKSMDSFYSGLLKQYAKSFSPETISYYAINYGELAEEIFEIALSKKEYMEVVSSDGEIMAEVVYVLKNEIPMTMLDILMRRTGIGTLGKPKAETLDKISNMAALHFGWNNEEFKLQLDQVNDHFKLPI